MTTATIESTNRVKSAAHGGTMNAMVQSGYGGLEVYRYGQTSRPTAGTGEVVVKVKAAGLDRGTWHMMTGRPYLMRLMGFGFSKPKSPVAGLEVAGTVVEVGSGVTRFKVGDEVFGVAKGSFAEYAAALESKLAKKPAALSFAQAASLAVSGSTALQAVEAGGIAATSKVLIIGASGGVGSSAVQIAKARGAHVTAVANGSKLDFVRGLGADVALSYLEGDFADGSVRYDVILDMGGNTALSRLRRALAPTGKLVFVGGELGGDWSAGFERLLAAAFVGMFAKQKFVMLASKETFEPLEKLAVLADAGKISAPVDRAMPLSALPEAMQLLVEGKVRGKLVLTVG